MMWHFFMLRKVDAVTVVIQMLGTRTVSERLRQLLVILADAHGREEGDCIIVDRSLTYEQIAAIVGATRQWVTQSLDKLKSAGVLEITRVHIHQITVHAIGRVIWRQSDRT